MPGSPWRRTLLLPVANFSAVLKVWHEVISFLRIEKYLMGSRTHISSTCQRNSGFQKMDSSMPLAADGVITG